jgi:hypothetical protein
MWSLRVHDPNTNPKYAEANSAIENAAWSGPNYRSSLRLFIPESPSARSLKRVPYRPDRTVWCGENLLAWHYVFLDYTLAIRICLPMVPTGGKRRGTSTYKCIFVSFVQYSVWQCSVYFNIPPYWFFAFAFCAYLKLEAWSKITSSFIRSLRYIWLLGAGSASLWSLSVNNTVYWDFLTLILFGPI